MQVSGIGDSQGGWPPPHSRLLRPPSAVVRLVGPSLAGPGLLRHTHGGSLEGGARAGHGQPRRSISLPSLQRVPSAYSCGSTRQPQQQGSTCVCAWDSASPTVNSLGPPWRLVARALVAAGVDDATSSRGSKLGAAATGALSRALDARHARDDHVSSLGASGPGFRPLGEQAGSVLTAAAGPAAAAATGTAALVCVPIDLSVLGGSGTVDLLAELGRGRQGVVYWGRWKGLDVAVKCCLFHQVSHTACSQATVDIQLVAAACPPSIVWNCVHVCWPCASQACTGILLLQCLVLRDCNFLSCCTLPGPLDRHPTRPQPRPGHQARAPAPAPPIVRWPPEAHLTQAGRSGKQPWPCACPTPTSSIPTPAPFSPCTRPGPHQRCMGQDLHPHARSAASLALAAVTVASPPARKPARMQQRPLGRLTVVWRAGG